MSEVEALREKLAESEKRHGEYITARLRLWEEERDALRAYLADAMAALQPFGLEARRYDPPEGDDDAVLYDSDWSASHLRIKHLRRARAVYDRISGECSRIDADESLRAIKQLADSGEPVPEEVARDIALRALRPRCL